MASSISRVRSSAPAASAAFAHGAVARSTRLWESVSPLQQRMDERPRTRRSAAAHATDRMPRRDAHRRRAGRRRHVGGQGDVHAPPRRRRCRRGRPSRRHVRADSCAAGAPAGRAVWVGAYAGEGQWPVTFPVLRRGDRPPRRRATGRPECARQRIRRRPPRVRARWTPAASHMCVRVRRSSRGAGVSPSACSYAR